jgi:hypothetical protein
MIYQIKLECLSKHDSFVTTHSPMLLPNSMIEMRNNMQYPTKEAFDYAIGDYINAKDDIIKAAKNENWKMRFLPRNKMHAFMLLYLFSEDKNGKVLVYYYDYDTKTMLELYTINTDWFTSPTKDAEDYPCLSYLLESVYGIKIK